MKPNDPPRFTPSRPGEIDAARRAPAPQAFLEGARLFNAGAYFACHEALEPLWLAEKGPVRDCYKGVIQIAGGLFHLERRNRNGALIMLPRGVCYVSRFLPSCHGADLVSFAARSIEALAFLVNAPKEAFLPRELIPRIEFLS